MDAGYTNVGYPTAVLFRTVANQAGNMDKAALALEKLHHIELLWTELERARFGTPEYEALMKKIRALSSEYHILIDPPKKPEK